MIKLKTFYINNLPLTNEILVNFINHFWEEGKRRLLNLL